MLKLHLQIASSSQQKRRFGTFIPSRAQFRRWIGAVVADTELTIRITDEVESTELNQKYRRKQGPTNVLSFPSSETPYLGDLVFCGPLVQQEAQQQNKSLSAHWAHLTIHGVLHLLGYDHERSQDAEIMEGLEIDILQKLGIANPY